MLDIPEGYDLGLPGGRHTFVREAHGPPGAPVVMLCYGLGGQAG